MLPAKSSMQATPSVVTITVKEYAGGQAYLWCRLPPTTHTQASTRRETKRKVATSLCASSLGNWPVGPWPPDLLLLSPNGQN